MSIEIQCTTEKLIVITIKLGYSKVPSKSTVPTYVDKFIELQLVKTVKLTTFNKFFFKYLG